MATYSTWNSADKGSNIILSGGDLTVGASSSAWSLVRATISLSSGKYYWEITVDAGGTGPNIMIGIATSEAPTSNYVGSDNYGWSYYSYNGTKYHNLSGTPYGASYTTGAVIGVALDMDNGKVWFSKNGVWQNSGDPVAGTNAAFDTLVGLTIYPAVTPYANNASMTANFGASSFSYTVPTGFTSGVMAPYSAYCFGYVYENSVTLSGITLRLYDTDTGVLQDETTSSGNGYYQLNTTVSGEHYVVCLDPPGGENYNHLILKNPTFYEI